MSEAAGLFQLLPLSAHDSFLLASCANTCRAVCAWLRPARWPRAREHPVFHPCGTAPADAVPLACNQAPRPWSAPMRQPARPPWRAIVDMTCDHGPRFAALPWSPCPGTSQRCSTFLHLPSLYPPFCSSACRPLCFRNTFVSPSSTVISACAVQVEAGPLFAVAIFAVTP